MTHHQIFEGTELFLVVTHLDGKYPVWHESSWVDWPCGLLTTWVKFEPLGIFLLATLTGWELGSPLKGTTVLGETYKSHRNWCPSSKTQHELKIRIALFLNNGGKKLGYFSWRGLAASSLTTPQKGSVTSLVTVFVIHELAHSLILRTGRLVCFSLKLVFSNVSL